MAETSPLDLSTFAHHFHALIDYTATGKNTVSSPLGAWLLLTQVAGPNPAALTATERAQIESWLGCEIDVAYAILQNLLVDMPEPVKLALQTWMREDFAASPTVQAWRANLGIANPVDIPIPDKATLDAWAAKNTLDIITSFPIDPMTLATADVIIANALATKIAWSTPFNETPNTLDTWHVPTLLEAGRGHRVHMVRDEDGNLFAVVGNVSKDGLVTVNAVIAEDPNLSPQHVIAFAEKYSGNGYMSAVDAADLPLDSRIHTVTTITGVKDLFTAVLPAWTAESNHNLLELNMPFPEAVKALTHEGLEIQAVQAAKAEYNKLGFEAAAISTLIAARAAMPKISERRLVEISFSHPFAVVAVHQPFGRNRERANKAWLDVPLFTTWVQQAAEVSDKTFE